MKNRQTRKRDMRLKTIRPGMDTSYKGLIKKYAPWVVVGLAMWALITKLIIMAINYNLATAGGY